MTRDSSRLENSSRARSSSTLGYERRYNPALIQKDEDRWVADLMANMPIAPPYFRRMKQVNSHGPQLIGPELPGPKARVKLMVALGRTRDRAVLRLLFEGTANAPTA